MISELASGAHNGNAKKLKRLKEAWICSVGMICRSKIEPGPYWIQLPKHDPPDVLAMRLIPTEDGRGQHLSELRVEVFEISEHDPESIEVSIERKLNNQDYRGMVVIGFVRRQGLFDHAQLAKSIQDLKPRAGSVNLILFEKQGSTDVTFIQLFPELVKFNADFGEYCKASDQRDFVDMRRASTIERKDATTEDRITVVP